MTDERLDSLALGYINQERSFSPEEVLRVWDRCRIALAFQHELEYIVVLGECKAFVGERNERKKQGRLRLRVARGRMRTDRGRLMTYKHTNKIAIEFTSTGSLRSPN